MDLVDWLASHRAARIACVTAAEHRGLAVLDRPAEAHLHLPQNYGGRAPDAVVHRSRPLVPTGRSEQLESVVDMLAHVATCLPRFDALVVWESAIQHRLTTAAQLRRVGWRGPTSRAMAQVVQDGSESVLETMAFHHLVDAGMLPRQQVPLLGHRVDLLLGERLVVQLDGFEFHSSAADRRRDMAHDARLQLDGYLVLRFDYVAVVHEWGRSLAVIRSALAQLAAPAVRRRAIRASNS